jgi:biotin carboxyl carrier protein
MSGRIVSLKKQVGDVVKLGESVLVLEAMKMENDIAAAKNGTIKEVYAKQGDLVKTGDKLVRIE